MTLMSHDLMRGDLMMYQRNGWHYPMVVECVEWMEDHVQVNGYDPFLELPVSLPVPFNYEIEVWNA